MPLYFSAIVRVIVVGAPLYVLHAFVCFVLVLMVNLRMVFGVLNKSESNKPMNRSCANLFPVKKPNNKIPFFAHVLFSYSHVKVGLAPPSANIITWQAAHATKG